MEKERIAMVGDSLNFSLRDLLQKAEPDLSGLTITPSGEIVNSPRMSTGDNDKQAPSDTAGRGT
jgi:hypothetical protein